MTSYQVSRLSIYKQIKEKIIELIRNGIYIPAQPLPSETQLAVQFNVSQGSIRQALEELRRENILYRIQGKGTYVNDYSQEGELFRFFKIYDSEKNKIVPESEITEVNERKADATERKRLELGAGETLYRISRFRKLDGKGRVFETLSLPAKFFPGLLAKKIPNHIYTLYSSDYGKIVGKVSESVFAVCDPKIASKLNLTENTPLLLIERITTDLEENQIELRRSWLETKSCHYHNQLN